MVRMRITNFGLTVYIPNVGLDNKGLSIDLDYFKAPEFYGSSYVRPSERKFVSRMTKWFT